ncbi:MAG: hypothetical protein AB1796_08400 [Bacillota bacterium]
MPWEGLWVKSTSSSLDMGIAMCNFSLVALEQGLAGRWVREAQAREFPGLTYIAGWQADTGEQQAGVCREDAVLL